MPSNPLVDSTSGNLSSLVVDDANIVQVCEALLIHCRLNSKRFHESINNFSVRCAKSRLRSWLREFFKDLGTKGLSFKPDVLRVLQTILDTPFGVVAPKLATVVNWSKLIHGRQLMRSLVDLDKTSPGNSHLPDEIHSWVKARAIAQAIDDGLHSRFASAYSALHAEDFKLGKNQMVLGPRQAVPSIQWHAEGFKPQLRKETYDDDPSQLRHLRLTPEKLPIDIRLCIGTPLDDILGVLAGEFSATIGCFGPVTGATFRRAYNISEPSPLHSFKMTEHDHPEDSSADLAPIGMRPFFDVSPKQDQSHLLDFILKTADTEKSTLCILPELSLNDSSYAHIKDAFRGLPSKHPMILVAGSRHTRISAIVNGVLEKDVPVNRLSVLFRAGGQAKDQVVDHDKMGTFSFKDYNGMVYYEGIHRSRELTVYFANGIPTCFLICKDILQASIIRALSALNVQFIFVAAMSFETGDFLTHFRHLSTLSGAVSVLACTTSPQGVVAAAASPATRSEIIHQLINSDHFQDGNGCVTLSIPEQRRPIGHQVFVFPRPPVPTP